MVQKCDLCKKRKATKEYISCSRRGIKVFLYCEKCYREVEFCRRILK